MTTHERLIELVPELSGYEYGLQPCEKHDFGGYVPANEIVNCEDCKPQTDTIYLHHILYAIDKHFRSSPFVLMASNGWLSFGAERTYWDLKLPFHLQSQETQDFIGRILGVDN